MKLFTFTCLDCGPIRSIPVDDIRRRCTAPPSYWCPTCGMPVTVDVVDCEIPIDAA